jgi:Na+/melibiose symporter-like transporter
MAYTALVTEKIGVREKLGFGGLSASINLVYYFKGLYYLFFLTNVMNIPMAQAGIVLALGTLWDAVNDPLIGLWAVNRRFKSGERIRPYAKWFSIPWALTLVLLFTSFGTRPLASIFIALAVYIVFETFNTLVDIAYNTMGAVATNVDGERRSINVFRTLGACFGSAIGAMACLPLLKLFGGLDASGNLPRDDSGALLHAPAQKGFFLTACFMGLIIIAGAIFHYATSKERVRPVNDNGPRIKWREALAALFRCRSWVLNTLYVICYGLVNTLLLNCVTYYATYVLGATSKAFPIQAIYLAGSVTGALLVTAIDRRIGRRKTMMLGACIALAGKLWFLFAPEVPMSMYLLALTTGMSVTIAYVLFNTNRNNIVDIVENASGKRLDSVVSTVDSFASKLAEAGATQAAAGTMAIAGFNAALPAQPPAVITAIIAMIGWLPFAIAACMLLLAFLLPIERELAAISRGPSGRTDS